MFKNPTQVLSRTEQKSQAFKTEAMNMALVVFLVVAIAFGLNPAITSAASGTYYGSGSSGTYNGGGSSGTYNGGGSSGTYYGGQFGTYNGGNSNPSSYTSPSSSGYWSATPIRTSTYSSPSYGNSCYSCNSYGGYSAPLYTYTPQPTYQYIPYASGSGGNGGGYVGNNNVNPGVSSGGQSQYVYSSNENTNTNSNTNNNTITNTFNPTNNNDARINLIVYGGGNESAPAQEQSYQNYQTYTQTYTQPNYAYDTSYTNTYSYPPAPTYVSYASNNAQSQNQNLGTPVSGVFLSQVPATGVGFGFKMTLFSVGLVLWSLFAAYMISRKKNGALANKVNAFKLANMQKKGIVG